MELIKISRNKIRITYQSASNDSIFIAQKMAKLTGKYKMSNLNVLPFDYQNKKIRIHIEKDTFKYMIVSDIAPLLNRKDDELTSKYQHEIKIVDSVNLLPMRYFVYEVTQNTKDLNLMRWVTNFLNPTLYQNRLIE